MTSMSKATLAGVMQRMELATRLMEEAADGGTVALFGQAYRELLLARGELAAFDQMLGLEEMLGKADTERPCGPALRIVR